MKRYVQEPGSSVVRNLLRSPERATCRIAAVEIASALARKLREGELTRRAYDRALARLDADTAQLDVLEVTPALTRSARRLVESHPLRALDALHLAAALRLRSRPDERVELVCYDVRLRTAGAAEGLLVLPRPGARRSARRAGSPRGP